ncbi:EAL domain-containing protein [Paenibacillus glycinis]|uniref:EAL domain-containing protein n=1 Tax=Paenibacillus glycinis TaxID=2697035 RepID=A0ABW9XY98_9BACL|nr:EAL domain-containing protein [Paenibacillus glycinis]NBD27207.1 EAL domain-containing protein [Paenibacillus glycinis]
MRNADDMRQDMAKGLVPYYQPILALDTRRIMGYEALGRVRTEAGVRSIGPFFADKSVPMAEQIQVDRQLREMAFAKFAAAGPDEGRLFINLKPSWIYQTFAMTGELPTLRLLDKYDIDPRRVVIEVTEESFLDPMEQLRSVIDLYRNQGCLIAIDDVGSGFSNMDRIAQIQPHILKIDIHMLKRSESHSGYYGVLRSFSMLADQIGASLLVEGVETEQDMQRAIEIGARYLQGYLFAPAEAEFRASGSFAPLIEEGLDRRRTRMRQAERYWSSEAAKLRLAVDAAWEAMQGERGSDTFIERLLPGLTDTSCIRIYMCSYDGIQISSNYQRASGEGDAWLRQPAFKGLNWSWRPYFIPISVELVGRPRAMVSQAYTDLDSFDRIRTISVPVGGSYILFLDAADMDGER